MEMMKLNGKELKIMRVQVASPAGTYRLRYVGENGTYLGEVDFVFTSQEAAAAILEDIKRMLGLSAIMVVNGPQAGRMMQ